MGKVSGLTRYNTFHISLEYETINDDSSLQLGSNVRRVEVIVPGTLRHPSSDHKKHNYTFNCIYVKNDSIVQSLNSEPVFVAYSFKIS